MAEVKSTDGKRPRWVFRRRKKEKSKKKKKRKEKREKRGDS